jgi:hypothetical protein
MGTTTAPPEVRPKLGEPKAGTSCPANVRETKIAFGFKPQSALDVANTPTELWSLTKTNAALSVVNPQVETDANDIGKGDEFPTQTFPTSMDTSVPVEKYTSSEFAAWLFCFTTGKATKTAAGTLGFNYVAQPSDPVVNCLDLPPFTFAEQIRPEPDSVIDRAEVGMVIQDWALILASGPGRANCRMTANFVGTGKVLAPSGITPFPTVTAEHFLNAASATININGIDYIANHSFISMELRWANNVRLDTGFYPGSGVDTNGFAIRGRMEYGARVCSLTFVARAAKGSQEFLNLISQTPGPATITLKGGLIETTFYHAVNISIPKCILTAVTNADDNGIVTVNCTATIMKDPAQPYILLGATTTKDAILGL